MRRAQGFVFAVFLASAPPAAGSAVSLVVSDETQAKAAGARAGKGVNVLIFDRVRLADPIEKGRFLAALQSSDQVVAAAGGWNCGWLGREVEGVPVHCLTPYDAGKVIDFARAAGWRRVAAVRMTGYEKVYGRLRARARERGVALVDVPIDKIRELPQALPRALKSASAVWILGGPALTEGAAFEFLVKTCLAKRIPLIAPGVESVAKGAFLGAGIDDAAMIRHAVDVANAAAKGEPPDDPGTDAPGGRLLVNEVLARRWGVLVPGRPK